MSEPSSTEPSHPSTQDLRAQIDRTREDLAETVAALTAKADVAGRARGKATELKDRAAHSASKSVTVAKDQLTTATTQARTVAASAADAGRRRLTHRELGAVTRTGPGRKEVIAAAGALAAVAAVALAAVLLVRRQR